MRLRDAMRIRESPSAPTDERRTSAAPTRGSSPATGRHGGYAPARVRSPSPTHPVSARDRSAAAPPATGYRSPAAREFRPIHAAADHGANPVPAPAAGTTPVAPHRSMDETHAA